jgi:hypothetical protein
MTTRFCAVYYFTAVIRLCPIPGIAMLTAYLLLPLNFVLVVDSVIRS